MFRLEFCQLAQICCLLSALTLRVLAGAATTERKGTEGPFAAEAFSKYTQRSQFLRSHHEEQSACHHRARKLVAGIDQRPEALGNRASRQTKAKSAGWVEEGA